MGLFKRGCLALAALTLTGCAQQTTISMTAKDQELLNLTLESSTRAFNDNSQYADLEAHLQMPRRLQHALSFYQEQYQNMGFHDYESLQKIGFNILREAILQEDFEAQMLSLYGIDLAKHPKLTPLLEQALESPYNLVQMTAIQALAKLPDDQAQKLLIKGCSSPFLDVAFMTTYILAERRHPETYGIIESLMHKSPPECTEFFPLLLAMLDSQQALTKLHRLLSHPQEEVRVAAIHAIAGTKKTELLSDVRSMAQQHNLLIQEAAAFALGELHDEKSTPLLQKLSQSSSSNVRLSALNALRKLGHQKAIEQIELEAQKNNIYAISLLREIPSNPSLLKALASQTQHKQTALNAALALLHQKDPRCVDDIAELLTTDDPNTALVYVHSPAKTMSAIKQAHTSGLRAQEKMQVQQATLSIRQKLLAECAELPENTFLDIAERLVHFHQNDVIPHLIDQMLVLKTTNVKQTLKRWQQKVGSPYVRAWSNLALLKLNEPGPWKENVLSWIKKRKLHRLVRLKDYTQLKRKKFIDPYEINPIETSQLLLDSYLAIAQKQDSEGIALLLDNLKGNDLKNKYAIAGLLILSTQ